ncbi:hypothetical protein HDE_09448 [Halotydeus destructor]|nr:hypothetical protein HDE_09448 [Halotydeus destructor]
MKSNKWYIVPPRGHPDKASPSMSRNASSAILDNEMSQASAHSKGYKEARNYYIKHMGLFCLNSETTPNKFDLRQRHATYKFEALELLRKNAHQGQFDPWRLEGDLDAILEDFEKLVKSKRMELNEKHSQMRKSFSDKLLLFCFAFNEVQLLIILLLLIL